MAQNTIKIGMITDHVGLAKPYVEPVAAGATFAVKELNARGSILGRQIELLDEPLMGLAPTVIEEIRHALNMLRQDG